MKTEQLITALSTDVTAVSRRAVGLGLLAGIVAGGLMTLALVVGGLRLRPDLDIAMLGLPFWMKLIYTGSLGAGASAMLARLARPEPPHLLRFGPVAIPFFLLALVGVVEMAQVPAGDWRAMWLGSTWTTCPWIVLGLSVPIFAGLLWSFRRLAPTRLCAAGAAAGFAAGAWAAALYCLHCPEVSVIFVLTWYTLGMMLAAVMGALVGPRLLRW